MTWYLRRLAGLTRRSLALWLFHLSASGPAGIFGSSFMGARALEGYFRTPVSTARGMAMKPRATIQA